jgi:hypothetical protein
MRLYRMLKREICMISTEKKAYVMVPKLQASEISSIFLEWEVAARLAHKRDK